MFQKAGRGKVSENTGAINISDPLQNNLLLNETENTCQRKRTKAGSLKNGRNDLYSEHSTTTTLIRSIFFSLDRHFQLEISALLKRRKVSCNSNS